MANGVHVNTLDYPDAVLWGLWVSIYILYCNWRTGKTYTIRPVDGHCAAKGGDRGEKQKLKSYIIKGRQLVVML